MGFAVFCRQNFLWVSICNLMCESSMVFNFMKMNYNSVVIFNHYVLDYRFWLSKITMNLMYYWIVDVCVSTINAMLWMNVCLSWRNCCYSNYGMVLEELNSHLPFGDHLWGFFFSWIGNMRFFAFFYYLHCRWRCLEKWFNFNSNLERVC